MPRVITLLVPPEQSDAFVSSLKGTEGVLSIQVYSRASVQPEADVLVANVLNRDLFEVMRVLERATGDRPLSLTMTSPAAAYSRTSEENLFADTIESVWEESEQMLQQTGHLSANFLLLMAFSGILAAIGLATGVLHMVLAAMLVVPGFQPIAAIPLGLVLRSRLMLRMGIRSTLFGYAVFAAAAAITFHALRLLGESSVQSFLEKPMVRYWASFSLSALLVSLTAAAAGVTIIPTHRTVLTAGVMVALALVPGASIFAICLTCGQWEYAFRGLAQWTMDAASIVVMGVLIFWLKKILLHKRGSWY